MVVKTAAATAYLQLSQSIPPHPPSSPQAIAAPSLKRCGRSDGALQFLFVQRLDRSVLFRSEPRRLFRSSSCEQLKSKLKAWKSPRSASLDAFSDEVHGTGKSKSGSEEESLRMKKIHTPDSVNRTPIKKQEKLSWSETRQESPDWERDEEMIPASIEWKATSVDIPFSLRLIKRKLKWEEGFTEVGESAYSSIKKAFSSMVFIIRELHNYTLQMRELLFYEDLQEILVRVQKEMHASFVWLFQQVFSHTPTLMVYVMILLANYSVHSMGSAPAVAAPPPPATYASVAEVQDQKHQKFDSLSMKTCSVSSSSGNATSIGGNRGGGGKFRLVASDTDGDGWFNRSDQFRQSVPDGASQSSTREEESTSGREARESELSLWNSIVEEASNMEPSLGGDSLDREMKQSFVSLVTARIDTADHTDHLRTELLYRTGLSEDPNNSLLLANYAQFLFLVVQDYDRAEDYFKKAIAVEAADAEAHRKYATFLWRARNDLWAAEESFLEAISAEPDNSYYAADYANFLWNTGGEDTCFPLGSEDTAQDEEAA